MTFIMQRFVHNNNFISIVLRLREIRTSTHQDSNTKMILRNIPGIKSPCINIKMDKILHRPLQRFTWSEEKRPCYDAVKYNGLLIITILPTKHFRVFSHWFLLLSVGSLFWFLLMIKKIIMQFALKNGSVSRNNDSAVSYRFQEWKEPHIKCM